MMRLPFDRSRHRVFWIMLALWSIVGLVATPALFAQPAPPLPHSGVDDNTAPPDAADDALAGEPAVRRLYIPAEELDAVLNKDNPGVLLPRDAFRKLWKAAKAAEANGLRQPASIVLSSADYSARAEGEQLRLTAEIRFTQFASGWCVLRIPVGGLHVEGASLDGDAAAVARDPRQPDALLLFTDARGPHRLSLELSAAITPVGSDGEVHFALAGAPSGTLQVSPPEDKTVLVEGLAIPESGGSDGEPLYRIPLGGRSQISLRLTGGEATQSVDSLLVAKTAYRLRAAPGEVTWTTRTSVTRYGRPLDVLTLTVPSHLDVAAVESEGLASWDINDAEDADRAEITLTYRQPFTGTRVVSIHGVFAPDGEEWSVPTLQLVDADSHIGSVAVQHDPGIRLQPQYSDGVRPAPVGELSDSEVVTEKADAEKAKAEKSVAGAREMGFRWTQEDFELAFFTPRKAGVMMVAMTNLLNISDDGLDLATAIDVQAAVAPLFEIQLTLPAEFELTALAVAGRKTDWTEGLGEVGLKDIRITLAAPLPPGQSRRVDFAAHADPEDWPVQSNSVLLSIPQVGLTQADMVEAQYGVIAENDLEIETVDLTGLAVARGEEAAALERVAEPTGRRLRLAFTHQDTEFSGELEVTRRPATFSVSTVLLSRLESERTVTQLHTAVTVEAGGLEGLLIQLPEDVTADARFTVVRRRSARQPGATSQNHDQNADSRVPAIVEQTVSDGRNGRRTWALKFDQRVHGTHELAAVLTQPRSDDREVTLPTPTFVGADRQHGWIAVEARDDQQLTVRAVDTVGQPLRDVDPIDLPGMNFNDTGQRRIVAGFHFARPGVTATVTEEQFERAAVPSAIAERFELDSLIGPAGEWQHRLHVVLRAVGVQSLQFALPDDAELWAVTLDRRPVEVRRSPQGYQVPLSSSESPADARNLQLFYRTNPVDLHASGRLQQAAPQLAVRHGSGETRPIDVLARDWTLQYPRDIVLLASRGTLTPTEPLQANTLVNRLWETLRVPSLLSGGVRFGIAAAVLLVAWLISMLRYARPQNVLLGGVVLAGVLILGFLVSMFAARGRVASEGVVMSTSSPVADASPPDDIARRGPATRGFATGGGSGAEGEADRPQAGAADPRFRQLGIGVHESTIAQEAQTRQAPMAAPSDRPVEEPLADRNVDGTSRESGFESPDAVLGSPVQQAAEGLGVRGALLSLSLDMEAPRGYRRTVFRSVGTDADGETAAVDVSFASRSFRQMTALIAAFGVLLVMWWMRDASDALRSVLAVLTVILPLALVTVVPPLGAMIVEGVLLGGVAGLFLWGVRALIGMIHRASTERANSSSRINHVAAGMVLLASLFAVPGGGHAEEPAPRNSPLISNSASGGRVRSAADGPAITGPGLPVGQTRPPGFGVLLGALNEETGTDKGDGVPTVIVPYADGDPFSADRVLLSRELFDALSSQAHPEKVPVGPAPVEGVVAEAEYTVEVGELAAETSEESGLTVTGRYVLYSFRDRPVAVRVPIRRVAIVSARLGDAPAVVRPVGNDGMEAIVPEAGRHELEVTFQVRAKLQANAGEFVLPLLPVAAGRLTVTLPAREDWAVSVRRNERTPFEYRRRSENGDVTVEVPIDRGGDVTVSWQPEQTADGRQGIVNVDSTTAVQVDDSGVHLRAVYDVRVRQGALSRLVFAVPQEARLMRLTGPDVGGWEFDEGDGESDGDRRTLTVFLRRSVNDETRIAAELFLTDAGSGNDASFVVPMLAPREITREAGEIAVLADDLREVRIDAADGLSRTSSLSGELPAELNPQSLPVRGTFRFSSRPWRLSLSGSVRDQETRVAAAHGMYVERRKVLVSSRLRFDLTGAPRRRVRVLLPHDFLLLDLHSPDVAEWFVEAGELVLDLGQPRVGSVVVTFEGHIPRFEGDAEAVLETPLPIDVQRQDSRLAIWIEDGMSATLAEFAGWRPLAPDELSAELRALHSQPVQFAFRSSEVEPELIILQMDAAQPRLACDAVTLIAVSDTSVDYGLTLRWTIERAATDRLTFTTPDWLAGRLQFTGAGLRRTSSDFLDDGRVRWTVLLENAVRGQFLVSAIATLPPPGNGLVAAPPIRFGEVTGELDDFTDVPVQDSFAVLVNLSGTQITAAGAEPHDEVRRDDLPFKLRDALLAQAMQVVRMRPGAEVTWRMQPVTEQQAATATVTSADLTTVLAADGSWRTQAVYRVRNRGHQFLAVRLPAGARLLSVLTKGRPARVLRTEIASDPVALVPLPQTSAADLSFEVALVLQGALPRSLSRVISVNGDRIPVPVPAIVSPRESDEYGVPVVHTSWTVSIPEVFRASPVMEDGLTNVSQLSEGAGGVMPYLQQLQELTDLNRLVKDSSLSYSQRKRAADNLRQLGSALQQSTDEYRLRSLFTKSPATVPAELMGLAKQQDRLLSESLRNAEALDGMLSSQEAGGIVIPDAKRDSRRYIEGNTATIRLDNEGAGMGLPAPKDGAEFRFDIPTRSDERAQDKSGLAPESKLRQSRANLREQLSRQQLLFEQAPEPIPQDASARERQSPGQAPSAPDSTPMPSLPRGGRGMQPQRGPTSGLAGGAVDDFAWGAYELDSRSLTGDAAAIAGPKGGLSLPVDIPLDGHTLEFSKLGGDPQLTLAIRTTESVSLGLRWLWTGLWIGVGVAVLWALLTNGRRMSWLPILTVGCLMLGILALAFLPWPAAWIGPPLLFAGGVIWLTSRSVWRRASC